MHIPDILRTFASGLRFGGKDVAEALGYSNTRDALYRHVEEEDKISVVIPDAGSNYKSKTTVLIQHPGSNYKSKTTLLIR